MEKRRAAVRDCEELRGDPLSGEERRGEEWSGEERRGVERRGEERRGPPKNKKMSARHRVRPLPLLLVPTKSRRDEIHSAKRTRETYEFRVETK
jgi:hypothetical protein